MNTTINIQTAAITIYTEGQGGAQELKSCSALTGEGGVDQIDVTNMQPGIYFYDDAAQGVKFVRLVAGPAVANPPGTFLPANYNPAQPKHWLVR